MLNHVLYNDILAKVNRTLCAYLPREEAEAYIASLVNEIARQQQFTMPVWERKTLTRQLLHDIPNQDRLRNGANPALDRNSQVY